jgi:hypothetical protein
MDLGHNTLKKNGVGMIITNQMSQSLIGYKAVNDRIIYIRLKAYPVNITCVQVHSPTSSAETADIEDFYRNLHSTLKETPRKDVLNYGGLKLQNRQGRRTGDGREIRARKQK